MSDPRFLSAITRSLLSVSVTRLLAQAGPAAEPPSETPGTEGNRPVTIGPEYRIDPEDTHYWVMASQHTSAALDAKGYEHRFCSVWPPATVRTRSSRSPWQTPSCGSGAHIGQNKPPPAVTSSLDADAGRKTRSWRRPP